MGCAASKIFFHTPWHGYFRKGTPRIFRSGLETAEREPSEVFFNCGVLHGSVRGHLFLQVLRDVLRRRPFPFSASFFFFLNRTVPCASSDRFYFWIRFLASVFEDF